MTTSQQNRVVRQSGMTTFILEIEHCVRIKWHRIPHPFEDGPVDWVAPHSDRQGEGRERERERRRTQFNSSWQLVGPGWAANATRAKVCRQESSARICDKNQGHQVEMDVGMASKSRMVPWVAVGREVKVGTGVRK